MPKNREFYVIYWFFIRKICIFLNILKKVSFSWEKKKIRGKRLSLSRENDIFSMFFCGKSAFFSMFSMNELMQWKIMDTKLTMSWSSVKRATTTNNYTKTQLYSRKFLPPGWVPDIWFFFFCNIWIGEWSDQSLYEIVWFIFCVCVCGNKFGRKR